VATDLGRGRGAYKRVETHLELCARGRAVLSRAHTGVCSAPRRRSGASWKHTAGDWGWQRGAGMKQQQALAACRRAVERQREHAVLAESSEVGEGGGGGSSGLADSASPWCRGQSPGWGSSSHLAHGTRSQAAVSWGHVEEHERLGVAAKAVAQELGESVAAVGDVGLPAAQLADDSVQGGQRLVDAIRLPQPLPCGARLVVLLRASQVHEAQLHRGEYTTHMGQRGRPGS